MELDISIDWSLDWVVILEGSEDGGAGTGGIVAIGHEVERSYENSNK